MAKRAKNGMGTIRKRKDGTWEGRFTAPDGRQHSVYGKDSKAVSVKLRTAQTKAASGAWASPSKMTVAEWLEIWLRDYKTDIKPQSRQSYATVVKRFTEFCGGKRLADIKSVHIARYMSDLDERGYSASSRRRTHAIMSSAFSMAVYERLISDNPVQRVKPPKKPAAKQMRYVDKPDFAKLVEAAQSIRYGSELLFLALTGIRSGELRGLKWEDVDLKAGTIFVCRQLIRMDSGEYIETSPKNEETRTIVLPQEAVRILAAQKTKQAEDRLRAGAAWVSNPLSDGRVFRQENGSYHTKDTIRRAVLALSKIMGTDLTPHSLRHSYAIAALRSGIDVKTVQHNLGHRSAAMTLDVYADYTRDAGIEGARRMDAFWSEAVASEQKKGGN